MLIRVINEHTYKIQIKKCICYTTLSFCYLFSCFGFVSLRCILFYLFKFKRGWGFIGGSRGGGGLWGLHPPPFQISKIKESNKPKQKIGDTPLEKEEERKSCMFV